MRLLLGILAIISLLPLASSRHAVGFDTTDACNASCMQCMKTYCSGRTTRSFIGRVYAAEDAVDDVGFKNIVDAMDVGLAGLARIQPCVGRASCPPAHVQAETLAAKMNDSFGDRLTGVFLEIIQPELWPRDNRTNGKFVADFLDTMRDNVPCHWFTGVYTNKSSFALIVGPYWMRRKYEDVRLWLPKHNDTPQFDPFGSWKQADFFQQDLELKHCGIVFDSDTGDLVRPGPQPSETVIPWWCYLVAGILLLVLCGIAATSVLFICRRRQIYGRLHDEAERATCNISILIDEIVALKEASIGATMVFPAQPSAFDVPFYNSIASHQRTVNRPLTRSRLLRLFSEQQQGHDGAVVIDLFGYDEPWIRSSGHQLPYDPSAPTIVQNRGSRHNSAAYASSLTRALILVVSKEAGTISVFHNGECFMNLSAEALSVKIDAFLHDLDPA